MVLAHGYLARPALMRPLRRRLVGFGHDVHLVPELKGLATGDVRGHARELDAAVDRVLAKTGCDRVSVVGTSLGGIIALHWAQTGGWSRVQKMVALGTPFRGASAAKLGARLFGRLSAGIHQLVPGSDLLVELATGGIEKPVTSISMRGDRVCPPEACVLDGMTSVVLDGRFGPLTHQLLMLDGRAAEATHEALC